MLSTYAKLKKIAAATTICCSMMMIAISTSWAYSPTAEDAAIINFTNRLGDLIPSGWDVKLSADQLQVIYSKAELLKSELAVAAADQALQANQNECEFIKSAAIMSLLQGTEAVLSFVAAYIRITLTPPETPLSTVRAYLSIARKAAYMIVVAPQAIANSIFMQVQYWQCKKELGA